MEKYIQEQEQINLVNLVNQNKLIEAYNLESEYMKNGFVLFECVDRLNNAFNSAKVCIENNWNTPIWIKNNKFLEQCYSRGWMIEKAKI